MQSPTLDFDTKHLTALFTALVRRVEKLERSVAQLRAEANQQAFIWPTRREIEVLERRLENIEERVPARPRG